MAGTDGRNGGLLVRDVYNQKQKKRVEKNKKETRKVTKQLQMPNNHPTEM